MNRLMLVCLLASGCGDETSSDDGGSLTCGAGTVEENGACVPVTPSCDAGRVWDGSACVDQCGAGTVFDTDTSTCAPACDGGQIWDSTSSSCVDQCGDGTVYDTSSGTCERQCADGDHYVESTQTCVHVPECLANAVLDPTSEDCVGWPWHELTLGTLCARRAYNICTPIFDCGCEHAGDTPFEGHRGVLPDFESCLFAQYYRCDHGSNVDELRQLVETGYAIPVPAALVAFDEYFALDPGVCTRPVGFTMWRSDLVEALVVGATSTGAECPGGYLSDAACTGDDGCLPNPDWNLDPLDPGPQNACLPKTGPGEVCDRYAEPPECVRGTHCLEAIGESGVWRCSGDRLEDQPCQVSWFSWCSDGLLCRPENLSAWLRGEDAELDSPTCQPAQGVGETCMGPSYMPPWTSYQVPDLCAAGAHCEVEAGEDTGLCLAAGSAGDTCDWCSENAFDPLWGGEASHWMNSWKAAPFTVCAGACDIDGTCAAELSVCPLANEDVYPFGALCGEVCAVEEPPVDEDRDGAFDCDDPDCTYEPECFERICDDGADNDGDGPSDCEDDDCCLDAICSAHPNCN